MANLEELKNNLEAATTAMGTLNAQTQTTNRYSEGLVKNISNLASMKTKGGTIWSIIGRLSSGTGLYDIQNRLRGLTVMFRYIEENEKARVERAKEYTDALEKHGGLLKSGLGENDGFCEIVHLFEQVKGKKDTCHRLSKSLETNP